MMIYKHLGVADNVLQFWKQMHGEWNLKSKFTTGKDKAQRLTGQATTALGNAIVNMIVHNNFVI